MSVAVATSENHKLDGTPTDHEKAVKAGAAFIERSKHFDVLHTGFVTPCGNIDVVAVDPADDSLHIVDCHCVESFSDLPDSKGNTEELRAKFEDRALYYLDVNPPDANRAVHFDVFGVVLLDNNKAICRYHQNVLSYGFQPHDFTDIIEAMNKRYLPESA